MTARLVGGNGGGEPVQNGPLASELPFKFQSGSRTFFEAGDWSYSEGLEGGPGPGGPAVGQVASHWGTLEEVPVHLNTWPPRSSLGGLRVGGTAVTWVAVGGHFEVNVPSRGSPQSWYSV